MAVNLPVTATWDIEPRVLRARLHSFSTQLRKVIRAGLVRNAEIMAEDLTRLTPRSDGTGDHVADGWEVVNVEVPGGDFALEVRNTNPRFDDPLEVSGGGTTSLGLILEYGSAPHLITAKPGKTLSFFWPAIGGMVHTRSVEHPGTRPYGMMAIATDSAIDRAQRLLAAARKLLEKGIL